MSFIVLFIFLEAISTQIFHKRRPFTKTMNKMSYFYFLFTDNKMDQYLHRCYFSVFVWSVSDYMESIVIFITISLLLFRNLFLTPVYSSANRSLF
jgi:hypothetical protein